MLNYVKNFIHSPKKLLTGGFDIKCCKYDGKLKYYF